MKQTAILFLFSIIFLACGKDYTTDLDTIKAADPTIPLETTSLNESTPDGTPFIANISEGDQKNQADQKVIPMMNVPTFGYYKLPDNSQPIFSESCLGTPDPSSCSVEMLKEWLHDQLKNAEIDLKRGEVSIQYVLFELNDHLL